MSVIIRLVSDTDKGLTPEMLRSMQSELKAPVGAKLEFFDLEHDCWLPLVADTKNAHHHDNDWSILD